MPQKKTSRLPKAVYVVLFAALTFVVGAALNFLLVDDVHSYTRVMLSELYASAGSIDTLFLGSSHAYRSFDPDIVDEQLGTTSFNAGSSQQLPDGSYYMLREAAAQNPLQTVYVETFYTTYNQSASSDVPLACYLLTDYMRPTSPNRYAYLWEMGGAAAFADLVFPARHAIAEPGELPALWRAKLTDGYTPGNYAYVTYPGEGEEYRGRGFVYTHNIAGGDFSSILPVDPAAPLSDFGREYLTRTAEFCRQNNLRLVLVTAPLPSAYIADTANYQAYVEAMRDFAAEYGSEYWDFSLYKDTAALDMVVQDFSDAHHLSGQGAEKFSRVFCAVAAQSASGEPVTDLFFETVQQKLQNAPDQTLTN